MSWPAPTRKDHETFCRVEGWRQVCDARGRTGTHHVTFELDLPNGEILRTRISHPPDRSSYGPSLWSHILRDQLRVSADEFWACVRDGRPPGRGAPVAPIGAMPAQVVHLLVHTVGLPDSTVAAMTRDEAIARLNRYWTEGQ